MSLIYNMQVTFYCLLLCLHFTVILVVSWNSCLLHPSTVVTEDLMSGPPRQPR